MMMVDDGGGRGLLKHKNPEIQVPEGFLSNVDENSDRY